MRKSQGHRLLGSKIRVEAVRWIDRRTDGGNCITSPC